MSSTKLIAFFSLLLLCIAGNAISQTNKTTEYYAGISGVISPFLEYHPVLPVTQSEAQTISHFRVQKDAKGRLLEIAWFDKFDAVNNSYFGTHKVVYSYVENQGYSRKYYDADGQPAFMWRHYYQGGEIHEERYSKVSGQRIVRLFNAEGKAIQSDIGAHQFSARYLDPRRYVQTQVNLAGEAVPFRKVMPFMTTIVSVDGDGYLDKVLNVDTNTLQPMFNEAAGFAALKVNFDENGLELGWEYQDASGSLVNLPDSDPDEPGAAFTVWFKQWRNQRLNQWRHVYGRYYDKTGAVIADARGVYLLHYQKDELNRVIEIAYYNAQGDLHFVKNEGFARKVFSYEGGDESGSGATTIEKRYDHNNQLIAD